MGAGGALLQGQGRHAAVCGHRHSTRLRLSLRCSAAESGPSSSDGASTSGSSAWWTSLNRKTGIRGPEDPPPAPPSQGMLRDSVGDRMAERLERIQKEERQRVWDAMRVAALDRDSADQMPAWFDRSMLDQEEEPVNRLKREAGVKEYQNDDTWLGGGGDEGGPGGRGVSGGGGGGWWREDDPYWPLRDWGDHPMRWWTLAYAGLLAVGGAGSYLLSGGRHTEALAVGWGAASLLVLAGLGMSDAAGLPGMLGVKLAWAVCAALFCKEVFVGWQQHRTRRLSSSVPQLGLCGAAALAMCAGFMLTDMSGLGEVSLPTNPGAVFKSPDVAYRSAVWERWGYGSVQMRV